MSTHEGLPRERQSAVDSASPPVAAWLAYLADILARELIREQDKLAA
jgi:hypothetical protein